MLPVSEKFADYGERVTAELAAAGIRVEHDQRNEKLGYRIREAQAVRGHRVQGIRDWLPIVVPLLVSGLERAMGRYNRCAISIASAQPRMILRSVRVRLSR